MIERDELGERSKGRADVKYTKAGERQRNSTGPTKAGPMKICRGKSPLQTALLLWGSLAALHSRSSRLGIRLQPSTVVVHST